MTLFTQILLQTLYYAIVMVLAVMVMALMLKGFFWKYIKVRLSFGRLVLIKIRGINRDYYAYGEIEEGFLVYTDKVRKKKEKRISIGDNSYFYKTLGVSMVDVNAETNAVCKPDYSSVTGFDAVKYNNLYTRALYSPQISDNKDKIIMVLLILILLGTFGAIYIGYTAYQNTAVLQQMVNELMSKMPTNVGGGGV